MSGIAEVLCNLGYTVQGSDASESANVSRLRDKGIPHQPSATGQKTSPAPMCWWCRPRSSATTPELMAARRRSAFPVVRRAEMLAELMRLKSCVAIRGHPWQDNHDLDGRGAARCRRSRSHRDQRRHHQCLWHQRPASAPADWMVVEADESDGTFPEAAGRRRHRHQCRSRASRSFQDLRCRAGCVPQFCRERCRSTASR